MNVARTADTLDGSEPADVALPLLVDAHGGRLYQLGLRFCGDADQASDLVQETFLEAYRSWDGFEGRSRPSTWLYTIAARTCQRMHRKRAGEPRELASLDELMPLGEPRIAVVPSRDEGPLEATLRGEARERIEAAIVTLPEHFRVPFVLKEIAGLSVADIAAALGEKEATVKTRLHRARLGIRKALEEVLPRREVPPPVFSKQVCLDLLEAKQDALDRGAPFEFPDQVVCERCSEVFATLDLAGEVCRDLARGELPEELRRRLLDSLRS